MVMQRRIQALLVKQEGTPDTEETPSASADALSIAGMFAFSRTADVQDSDEITGSLDDAEFHIGRVSAQLTFPVFMKGAGTAGEAPQLSVPLKICGMAESLLAAQVPATGTTDATGGTTNSFTINTAIATDWSTVDGIYEGMPIELTTNPAVPLITICTRYTVSGGVATVEIAHTLAAALDTDTNARVLPAAAYVPASASIPHATAYAYEDGVLDKLIGSLGTFNLQATVGQAAQLDFTLTGRAPAQSDAPVPATTVEATRPPIWKNGTALLNGKPVGMNGLSLTPNNNVVQPDDPNGAEGYALPEIVSPRRIQGQVDPNRRLVATEAVVAAFLAGTTGVIHARAGQTAGNRWAVTVRRAKYRGVDAGERGGISIQNIPFSALGSDDEVWFTFF